MVCPSHNALSECQLRVRGVFFHVASYPRHSVFKCFVAQMNSKIIKCRICQVHGGKLLIRKAKLVKGLKGQGV